MCAQQLKPHPTQVAGTEPLQRLKRTPGFAFMTAARPATAATMKRKSPVSAAQHCPKPGVDAVPGGGVQDR